MSTTRLFTKILSTELINKFQFALKSRNTDKILTVWYENPQLRACFCGKPINFGTEDAPDIHSISLVEMIHNFKSVLSGRCNEPIWEIWHENFLLRAWFCGKPINFGAEDTLDIRAISLKEVISNFKSVLSSQHKEVIEAMWQATPQLRAWFCGKPINFSTEDAPDICITSVAEIISNFKSVLSSRRIEVICAIWNGNTMLHNAIKNNPDEQATLLKKVFSSASNGKSNFINQYLKWINNEELLTNVLIEIENSCNNIKTSAYAVNQIIQLKKRINELRSPQTDSGMQDVFYSDITPIVNPKKRGLTTELDSNIQSITDIHSYELSILIKSIPLYNQLHGGNYFLVTWQTSMMIKNLKQSIRDEMGIQYIRKMREQSQYKIKIASLNKYNEFYNKHSHLLLLAKNSEAEENDSLTYANNADDFAIVTSSNNTGFDFQEDLPNQSPMQRNQAPYSPTLYGHLYNGLMNNGFASSLPINEEPSLNENDHDSNNQLSITHYYRNNK